MSDSKRWTSPDSIPTNPLGNCIPGSQHLKVPVTAGQRFSIRATKGANFCEPKEGWSWDNGEHWTGPEGLAPNLNKDAMMPNTYLGTLVGSISEISGELSVNEQTMRSIFLRGFYVGAAFDGIASLTGYLYLLMND